MLGDRITYIYEAFNLVPFTQLLDFSMLGNSRNVFYNYYNFLKDANIIDFSYREFLNDFDFKNSDNTLNCKHAERYLKDMGVLVVDLPQYDIQNEIKIIGTKLSETNRYKTTFALNNDAIMLKFLGDNNVEIHPIDPVFVTWDKTMFGVLNDFYRTNPLANKWMQFTPSQFIDRYSLLSFSINEETISKDILAMLSGDIVQHTTSLIDSLALILNPNNEVGLEYAKKFAKMKDTQIYMTERTPDSGFENPDNYAIDYIVSKIVNHFREDNQKYLSFKTLFSSMEFFDKIITIFSDAVDYYQYNKKFDPSIIDRFEELL